MPSKRARERKAARPAMHAQHAQIEEFPFCEPKAAGMSKDCFGPLGVHHVWPLGRGGPIGDRRSQVTACAEHNRLISQDPHGMVWGMAHGMLVSAAAGADWLDQGGYQRE